MSQVNGNVKRARGAPSKLTPQMAAHIHVLSRRGFTEAEIAELKGITPQTLANWKADPAFFDFLKSAKAVADSWVERSLYERAVGYDHPEDKIFCDTGTGKVTTVRTIKHVPPDVTAQIFWLKNRKRLEWRERTAEEAESSKTPRLAFIVNVNGTPERMAPEQFADLMDQHGRSHAPAA